MARHKRKPPQIITERPLDATTRKFLEKRDGTKNINWATQEKMDAIVAKKRKAEDEELYNSSDVRRKQQRLVVEEAAGMPMLRGRRKRLSGRGELGWASWADDEMA
ncbi:hypothetical protein LTR74_000749 [Friedmanniomyces endolithicus]|nr:hypothetical protein LTR74_000749 [Friedmanniomyces endolithicus]